MPQRLHLLLMMISTEALYPILLIISYIWKLACHSRIQQQSAWKVMHSGGIHTRIQIYQDCDHPSSVDTKKLVRSAKTAMLCHRYGLRRVKWYAPIFGNWVSAPKAISSLQHDLTFTKVHKVVLSFQTERRSWALNFEDEPLRRLPVPLDLTSTKALETIPSFQIVNNLHFLLSIDECMRLCYQSTITLQMLQTCWLSD